MVIKQLGMERWRENINIYDVHSVVAGCSCINKGHQKPPILKKKHFISNHDKIKTLLEKSKIILVNQMNAQIKLQENLNSFFKNCINFNNHNLYYSFIIVYLPLRVLNKIHINDVLP